MQKKALDDQWLLDIVKENDFWLRSQQAEKLCKKLNIKFGEPSYYRDIKVWLPDVQMGKDAMPVCPSCKSNSRVGVHAWRDNHFSR